MNEQVMLILSGLQGSGKSTFAKRLVEENPGQWARINWDTQRRNTPGYKFSKEAEKKIKLDSHAQVYDASRAGLSVIVDNMNLSDASIGEWTRIGSQFGFHVRVQTFDTPVEECVRRDATRTGSEFIGRAVIERLALWHGLIEFPVGKKIAIVDVDGTLADCSHRRATKEKKCRECKNGFIQHDGREFACHVCYRLRSRTRHQLGCVLRPRLDISGRAAISCRRVDAGDVPVRDDCADCIRTPD